MPVAALPHRPTRALPCPAGYTIYTSAADLKSCNSGANPFSTCSSTAGKLMAVETDGSCVVRVFVLGDSKCSQMDTVGVAQG